MLTVWAQVWPNLVSTVILGALTYGLHSHFFVKFKRVVNGTDVEGEISSPNTPPDSTSTT